MTEKSEPENIKILSDEELYTILIKQDANFAALSNEQQEKYKQQQGSYTLSNEHVSLGYFGAKHIFEPNNPQFGNIAQDFNLFLEGKNNALVIVLVEGAIPRTTAEIGQDIHETSERGFITHLAKNMDIKVECVEPDRIVEIKYLLEKFKPDEIEYYYYLRAIRDYFRSGRIQDKTTFEDYTAQLLNKHKQMFAVLPEFANFDYSFKHMKQIHENITGEEFDVNKRLDVNPRRQDTIMGKIAHATSSFRDFCHIRKIEQCLIDGYSVFIVNGEDHAIVQRPALELMFME